MNDDEKFDDPDNLRSALKAFAKDTGFYHGRVAAAALEYIDKLEAELNVIPPGGVAAGCILKGCKCLKKQKKK